MAKTFNGNIWNRIGDTISLQDAMRREQQGKTLGGLLDAAKFIEKTNANRRLRDDWQKYFDDRKAAAEAAKAAEDENALNDALGVEDSLSYESLPTVASIFGDAVQVPNEVEASIWDPSMIANGFSATVAPEDVAFIQGFDPKTASPEDIVMAQRIVGTDDDGIWGKKSRAAYKKFMGGI